MKEKTNILSSLYRYILMLLIVVIYCNQISYSQEKLDSSYFFNKYSQVAKKIQKSLAKDSSAWNRLAYFCDTFGNRLSGSENLNKAILWAEKEMKEDGFKNVQKEEVSVPRWVRGNESLEMLQPRNVFLPFLANGGSIGTDKNGIIAEIIVFQSFEELESNSAAALGKIVVFDVPFENYGQAVQYRSESAIRASKYGALAVLNTPASPGYSYHPHTGVMSYSDDPEAIKIPSACITREDADMLLRFQRRGIKPVVHLKMEASTLSEAISYNVMCDLKGSDKDNEILVVGGHTDSWDVGLGAQDDASGCIAVWQAVKLLKDIGLTPKRTIRIVLFVNEENGTRGGKAYADKHKAEDNVLAFEFDAGVYQPYKFVCNGNDNVFNTVKAMESAFNILDTMKVDKGWTAVDVGPLYKIGVPAMTLTTKDDGKYFLCHHSVMDTPDKVSSKDMNKCVAEIALMLYMYADLPDNFFSK